MSIIERAVQKLDPKSQQKSKKIVDGKEDIGVVASIDTKLNSKQVRSENINAPTVEPLHIPLAKLSALGMVTPNAPRSTIAEEYRAIKRPLLLNLKGGGASKVDHANLVMVASALSGEGKTFSSINLAMSIAMEQEKSVLFVDADVSKASAGALLGDPDKAPG